MDASRSTSPSRVEGPSSAAPPIWHAQLDSLTSMRFIAAVWVFLFHCISVGLPFHAFITGYLSVPFFFVLSGFMMVWSTAGERPNFAAFLRRRFARIYPVYFVMVLTVTALLVVGWMPLEPPRDLLHVGFAPSGEPRDLEPMTIFLHLFLLQGWSTDQTVVFALTAVGWTLSHEVFFYLLFPVLLVLVKRRTERQEWIAVVLIAIGGLALSIPLSLLSSPQWVPLPPAMLGIFAVGMKIGLDILRGKRLARWLPPVLLLAIPLVIWARDLPAVQSYVIFVPIFAILVMFLAQRDIAKKSSILSGRLLVLLGKWSYGFYFTHLIVLKICVEKLDLVIGWPPALMLAGVVAMFLLAVGLAAALYYSVEKPMRLLLLR